MIGTSFQNIGVDNTISVQDIKASGLVGLDWSFATTDGDTLMVWDASQQAYATTLYYTGDNYDADGMMEIFGATPKTWFDTITFATSDFVLGNGDAFWIMSSTEGAKVTIAGEVPTSANSVTLVPGLNMIANPYPKAVKINDMFTVTGLTGLDWSFATTEGDTLMIWDASQQAYATTLYYTGDDYDADGMMEIFGATPKTWFDTITFATADIEIPAGGAFWIMSSGNGTLTFK